MYEIKIFSICLEFVYLGHNTLRSQPLTVLTEIVAVAFAVEIAAYCEQSLRLLDRKMNNRLD